MSCGLLLLADVAAKRRRGRQADQAQYDEPRHQHHHRYGSCQDPNHARRDDVWDRHDPPLTGAAFGPLAVADGKYFVLITGVPLDLLNLH